MNRTAELIKQAVPMDRAAEYYGFHPNRGGYISCPFHREKTASLKLYTERDGHSGWYCFGCGRGGSVIDFVMQIFQISYAQAIVRISSDFALGLTAERTTKADAAKMIRDRKAAEKQKQEDAIHYQEVAAEHRYWWEIKQVFAPDELCAISGYIHPFYAEAIKRLPYLSWWLDEHISDGR